MDDEDQVNHVWNKHRTLKNKADHEAIKEYWEESVLVDAEEYVSDNPKYVSDNPITRFRPY
jgi:hypothetical protein